MDAQAGHGELMDRIYRYQRHFGIYDATRKYYLLGRDPLIAALKPPAGGAVLEIGCGTGRNLVIAAQRYPDATLQGIDLSSEMLAAAGAAILKAGLRDRVRLARADAASFDPQPVFGVASYDRIFVSYALSMIPQWRSVLATAADRLAPGGELHVADFGDFSNMPGWTGSALRRWLHWHHVVPRHDLREAMETIAAERGGAVEGRSLHGGYAWVGVLRRAASMPA